MAEELGRSAGTPPELEVHVVDPEHVGQLPTDIFALLQRGTFEGTEGKAKTVIELTHSKARVDHGVELAKGYGSKDRTYRVYFGRIVWETEGDIIPEEAPVQSLFDAGPRMVKGVKYVGDVPAKGQGKIKPSKRKVVEHGND